MSLIKKLTLLIILLISTVSFSYSMARGPQGDRGEKGDKGDRGKDGEPGDAIYFKDYQGFLTDNMSFLIELETEIKNVHAYRIIPSTQPATSYKWVLLPSSADPNLPYVSIDSNLVNFYNMKIGDAFGVSWQIYLENR